MHAQTINQSQDGDKVGFILERIYPGSGDGTYSLTRIYEVIRVSV